MLPIVAAMMRPVRQAIVISDQVTMKFDGLLNAAASFPVVFAESSLNSKLAFYQILPRMAFLVHVMANAEALICDLKQNMASGGSKRWRALYPESTTYEMLPSPVWKH